MFLKNNNPYEFQFIITGIKGDGITTVYLPDTPLESEILFRLEQKFTRTAMPVEMVKWSREWEDGLRREEAKKEKAEKEGLDYNEVSYEHLKASEIVAFEDQEWERINNGIFFWNNNKVEYITGFNYWYINYWLTYFGYPSFRATDKEICYFLKLCEEDPDSYGTLLNTIRRYGKSSIMGAWIMYGTITNEKWTSGMQGQTDPKISQFFRRFVVKPFYKLPEYIKPEYDTSTEQKNEMLFDKPVKRGVKNRYEEDNSYLESILDFRSSEEGAYDGEVLYRYLVEEPGKTLKANVYERWGVVKPCLKRGTLIRGKALWGTTVEFMQTKGKGGMAYKKLFYESDVDNRGEDGRTISGLYMCFVPGDSALEDGLDEWGYPDRELNKELILRERAALRNTPVKHSMHIRQYPLSIKQIFYVGAADCEFNVTILQDRLHELEMDKKITERGDLIELDGRDSKVIWKANKDNGKCLAYWLPDKDEETNLIEQIGVHPDDNKIKLFKPLNNAKIRIGMDPVQHSVEKLSGKSKPVVYVKRLYDATIDGVLTDKLMKERAEEKYAYQTNIYALQYDHRFMDPNEVFEYVLRICRFFGASLNVEKQKAAIINYFYARGFGAFIMSKFQNQQEIEKSGYDFTSDGTAASQMIIQQYTSLIASYVEYFGHTSPFIKQIEDHLLFNAMNTREFDYTVATGFTELACQMKTEVTPDVLEITDILREFDNSGNRSELIY